MNIDDIDLNKNKKQHINRISLSSSKKRKIANELVQTMLIGQEITIIDFFTSESPIHHKGVIVNETRNTFVLLKDMKEYSFPKNRIALIFQNKKSNEEFVVEGINLLGRPEERIKSNIRKLW
ncbi:MAG: ribonuclease P protein subunit [Candidatus Hodarchaeales archaeon]|jgi:RNase P/RNase MRP subunit p29